MWKQISKMNAMEKQPRTAEAIGNVEMNDESTNIELLWQQT